MKTITFKKLQKYLYNQNKLDTFCDIHFIRIYTMTSGFNMDTPLSPLVYLFSQASLGNHHVHCMPASAE